MYAPRDTFKNRLIDAAWVTPVCMLDNQVEDFRCEEGIWEVLYNYIVLFDLFHSSL